MFRFTRLPFFGLALILTLPSFAQVPDPVAAAEAPVPGAGHHYIGTGAETVNPADGSLSFDLPLTPANSRELNFPFGIRFSSGTEQYFLSNQAGGGPVLAWTLWGTAQYVPWQNGGWSYDLPVLTAQASVYWQAYIATGCPNGVCQYALNQCFGSNNYVFRGLDENQHTLQIATVRPGPTNSQPNFCPPITQASPGDDYHGVLAAMQTNSMAPPVTVTDRAGTVYQFPGASDYNVPTQPVAFGSVASSIADKNGNQVTLNANGKGYTDTIGRNAVTWTGLGTSGDQISVAGLGGPITLQWINTNLSFPETGQKVSGTSCSLQSMNPTTQKVISEIDLPNGQKYKFQYDGTYAKISKITFPGGGYVRYVWGLNSRAKDAHAAWTVAPGGSGGGGNYSCNFNYDVPAITDRYVSFDGTTEVLHQQFQYTTTWNISVWTSKQTTVTSTDLVTNQVTKTKYTYAPATTDQVPITGAAGIVPVETTVLSQDGSGNTLRTVNKAWKSPHALVGEQTILENGQGTATQRCYDSNEEVTYLYEYGFQSEGSKPADPSCYSGVTKVGALTNSAIGPLRRQTVTVYHPYYQWSYPNPTLPHIVNAPDSVTVYDGSGTILKKTLFGYDESSAQSSGANVQLVAPPESATANITTIQRLISGSNYSKTTYTYYDTGQVASMTDPCGNASCSDMTGSNHTTSYSYADSYASGTGSPPGQTNAYLTQVTYPNTGVAHTESFTWGYSDGQIRSHTDQNSQTTSFVYNDPGLLARLTEIDYADTGQTTVAYNDATYNSTNHTPNYAVTQVIASGTNKVTTTAFDGLGHKVLTLLTSDPQGADYTATTYDGFGRTRLAYNPTRCNPPTTNCSNETTWGYSTTNYDPLSRVTTVVKQDGSTTSTTYSGACTTVTDEAGKSRKSCLDGLSFLTGVWEDASGLNYETDYTYDALGNLIYVNQKGSDITKARTRSFQYDSLSRLTSAANPESGNLAYVYDPNGNLTSKTSPAPNQPLSTVTQTISFCYDSLGRVTSKWYTTPNCASPSSAIAQYAYDQTSFNGLTITNGTGRRTSMTDPSGSSGWSYDQLGRVLTLKRQIGSYNRTVSYQYTVGGLETLVTTFNGDQRQYSYSAAGDATTLSDPTRSPAYNFVTSASYTPGGALAQAVYGHTSTFAGVTETGVFNTRLQPCWFYATTGTALPTNEPCNGSTSAANVIDLKFNFNAGTNDNGNVIQIINNRDNNRTQNFLYDSLNRIQQAYTTGPNWGETFSPTATAPGVAPTTSGIDAWGNLTNRSGVTGKTNSESALNCAPANINNQLNTCFVYDAAGNLTSNGGLTYTYDAENQLSTAGGATYTYDGDGNRVKKTTGSTGTIYWREASGVTLTETDATNTVQHSYIFFAGRMIARTDHQPSWSAHFYFSDHLGSSNVVTNAGGTIEDESDFYPYGGEIVITNNVPQNYKFTGKERDTESGLDNFGARYYASNMGRFMTPDWAARPTTVPYASFGDPQTLNLYTYVENAPVNRADADGHDAKGSCTGWASYFFCRQRQSEEAKKENEKNRADAIKEAEQSPPPPRPPALNQKAWNESIDQYHPGHGAETTLTIAKRVNHEVRGMGDTKNESQPLSRSTANIVHQRINGIQKFGTHVQRRASLASPRGGSNLPAVLNITREAVLDHLMGNDPTHGAYFFNMRKPSQAASDADYQGATSHTVDGPYTSPTPYKYIVTYGDHQ